MEKVLYKGKIFEIVEITNNHEIEGKVISNTYEYARRSPGVRGIIIKDNKILLTKEYRYELDDYDYRLPGGKVFDNLDDYNLALSKNNLDKYIDEAIYKELLEEVGIKVFSKELYGISKAGSTIIWDLYYYLINDFEFNATGQQLEKGEFITYEWFDFKDVKDLIVNNCFKENRSIGIVLKFILQNEA